MDVVSVLKAYLHTLCFSRLTRGMLPGKCVPGTRHATEFWLILLQEAQVTKTDIYHVAMLRQTGPFSPWSLQGKTGLLQELLHHWFPEGKQGTSSELNSDSILQQGRKPATGLKDTVVELNLKDYLVLLTLDR